MFSALPPIATGQRTSLIGDFVPKATFIALFDLIVGLCQERGRHRQTEPLSQLYWDLASTTCSSPKISG
jgi:hypothetical protein